MGGIGGFKLKAYINSEQAINLLPEGETVHTFYNRGFLLGVDWDKKEIVEKIKASDVLELTGPVAKEMGHGLCAYNNTAKYQSDILFIETDEDKLNKLEEELRRVTEGLE